MAQNRRHFIRRTAAGLALLSASPMTFSRSLTEQSKPYQSKPWIELSKEAYLHNATQIGRMTNGKPIVAVLKNNAYGVGEVPVAQFLDQSSHVFGMAVVKDEAALAMRTGGVKKPILLMGDFDDALGQALVKEGITLSVHSWDALSKIKALSIDQKVKIALYIDTGLGRMGIPYQETTKIAQEITKNPNLSIEQTFSTLTSPQDFAKEQIMRFEHITTELDEAGIPTGLKHLAPSYSLIDLPSSHQQAVRPGILLHGSFPSAQMQMAKEYPLKVPYRLKAPVIRLEKLIAGDTIGFSRFYKVEQDEWIATLPIGWADGYDSGAENGALVLLGDQLFPVVNVNASHANISLGAYTSIKVGDAATLIGPERPEITPEGFGQLIKGHNYLQINYKESIPKHTYASF
ncbi:MAG: alanine racemase [Bacteroidota bacterium]